MRSDNTKKYLITRGIFRGILAAIFGSSSFTIGKATMLVAANGIKGLDEWFLPVLLGVFLGGTVVAIPFTILGGIWLAFELQKSVSKTQPTKSAVFYKGAVLGFEMGVSIFVLLVILYFNRGDWRVILSQGMLGIMLCTIIAGLTALGLLKDISSMPSEN